jgi:membrane-associated phospholipid phosphatase
LNASRATAVSLSRFGGRRHFLSDVLVGSAIGYGIGRYVYRTHDASLDLHGGRTQGSGSKRFPFVAPQYNRRMRSYGITLRWSF